MARKVQEHNYVQKRTLETTKGKFQVGISSTANIFMIQSHTQEACFKVSWNVLIFGESICQIFIRSAVYWSFPSIASKWLDSC